MFNLLRVPRTRRFLKAFLYLWLIATVSRIALPASVPAQSSAVVAPTSHYERPLNGNGLLGERVIVFVHGIFGDANNTWTSSQRSYWPRMLTVDPAFRDYDVYVVNFESPKWGNTFTVDEVVTSLQNQLSNDQVFEKHQEVILVCHSLGGIIAQEFLLTFRQYASKVSIMYFFAVPSEGSPAQASDAFARRVFVPLASGRRL